MRKKFGILSLLLIICLALVACGSKKADIHSGEVPVNPKISIGMNVEDFPGNDNMESEDLYNSGYALMEESVKYQGTNWYAVYTFRVDETLESVSYRSLETLTEKQRDKVYDNLVDLYGEPTSANIDGDSFEYYWETGGGYQAWFNGSPSLSYFELLFN